MDSAARGNHNYGEVWGLLYGYIDNEKSWLWSAFSIIGDTHESHRQRRSIHGNEP